jgi:predicted nucleic acid-binding protein
MLYPISYADAFAVAAALQQNATLVTGDPELNKLQGRVSIEMLQRDT